MNKTKIDWCDMSWNPVTGCLHDCEYCYARKIAMRFDGHFQPQIHYYRLNEPEKIKKPQTIFVCSMADLFGEWVPDEWINEVFKVCAESPQHRYLFLTKNPKRYETCLPDAYLPKNWWFGATATSPKTCVPWKIHHGENTFISIEPIAESFEGYRIRGYDWVIVGAETGNRKGKTVPEKSWIDAIVSTCKDANTPVFMKESLRELMGTDFIQEYPWGGNK